jgi:hypothetical protein
MSYSDMHNAIGERNIMSDPLFSQGESKPTNTLGGTEPPGHERVERDETPTLISCDKVEGTAVFDRAGHRLGTIETLMIDKISGTVRYAVLSFGGILGFGSQHYPLPWAQLHYDIGLGGYVVGLTEQQVHDAPSYRPGDSVDLSDRDWGEKVNGYYEGPTIGAFRP